MSESLSTDPYKGVRDFYPAEWAMHTAMFECIRTTLSLWGYEEYNASPLERAELYEAKTSEEIVNEQTYTFTDRGERRVTLRPEMTPTLARMVAARQRELTYPLRWFSIGNRFRYERPQKGRLREFYQADIDLIGLPEGEADVEIVHLASEILKAFGATEKDFTIRVNSRQLINSACKASGLEGDAIRMYQRLLDKKSKIDPEDFTNALNKITKKDPFSYIENTKDFPEVEKEKRVILDRIDILNMRGVGNIVFDPYITRGFDYYTGMVFEIYDANLENTRSIFGGGRYDNLISLWSGKNSDRVPAVGFAIGDITLADFLNTHSLMPKINAGTPKLYIGTPSQDDIKSAQSLANTLREEGVSVFVNLSDRTLGHQIKDAVKRNIPFFIAYGANEVADNTLCMKILSTGKEIKISVSEVVEKIRSYS